MYAEISCRCIHYRYQNFIMRPALQEATLRIARDRSVRPLLYLSSKSHAGCYLENEKL